MRILFIGSDREIVYMTSKILRRNQYDVSAAIGQSEAIEMLYHNIFDLVIMDCDMSESDCDRMIQKIKSAPDAAQLLLISRNREDEVPLLKAGADDWVQKPYQMDVLLARMAALLRRKGANVR